MFHGSSFGPKHPNSDSTVHISALCDSWLGTSGTTLRLYFRLYHILPAVPAKNRRAATTAILGHPGAGFLNWLSREFRLSLSVRCHGAHLPWRTAAGFEKLSDIKTAGFRWWPLIPFVQIFDKDREGVIRCDLISSLLEAVVTEAMVATVFWPGITMAAEDPSSSAGSCPWGTSDPKLLGFWQCDDFPEHATSMSKCEIFQTVKSLGCNRKCFWI